MCWCTQLSYNIILLPSKKKIMPPGEHSAEAAGMDRGQQGKVARRLVRSASHALTDNTKHALTDNTNHPTESCCSRTFVSGEENRTLSTVQGPEITCTRRRAQRAAGRHCTPPLPRRDPSIQAPRPIRERQRSPKRKGRGAWRTGRQGSSNPWQVLHCALWLLDRVRDPVMSHAAILRNCPQSVFYDPPLSLLVLP
jgi:hypothetical protein